GAPKAAMSAAYRRHGDFGSATQDLLTAHKPEPPRLTTVEVETVFRRIAATGGAKGKGELVAALLRRATPLEAKYLIKVMTGDLRIGLKENLVEESIAAAFEEEHSAVRRANMLLGDIGAALRFASAHQLGEARMRMFHPIQMMLASPVQDSAEAMEYFERAAVEDKYDGIRAQAHTEREQVRIFSR